MAVIPNTPIAVIGAGSWGTALALLLARNGNETRLWGNEADNQAFMQKYRVNERYLPEYPFPDSLVVTTTLAECVEGAQDILLVVPSHAFRIVLKELKDLVSSDARLAWATKGLDPKTKQLLHEVVKEELSPDTPVAVLAGPSFAKEVAANQPTAVSLAGNNESFILDCIERFHNDRFRIYVNDDMIGVQLFGALKNILAIAVGIADGLHFGANSRAALITRGLAEMARLNEALGGQAKTLLSLAGVGDLVLTCTDDQSRNRRFGLAIGVGADADAARATIGQEVEGLSNTKQVHELAQSLSVEMPIIEQVYNILMKGQSPKDVVAELLERAPKHE